MIQPFPTLVIAGSVRPRRVALHIARWVAEVGRETTNGDFEVVEPAANETASPAFEAPQNLAASSTP